MDGDEIAHVRTLVTEYKKRLHLLEVQAVRYGVDCPPHIQIEINEIRRYIAAFEQQVSMDRAEMTYADDFTELFGHKIDTIQQQLQEVVITEKRVYRLLGIPIWSVSVIVSRAVLILFPILCIVTAFTLAQVAAIETKLSSVQDELRQARTDLAGAQSVLASLQGTVGQGAVLRTRADNTLLIVQLPQLEPGRVYQVFLSTDGSGFISAGTFTVDQQGFASFALAAQLLAGTTVAVTSEPAGGSPVPTSEPLLIGPVTNV